MGYFKVTKSAYKPLKEPKTMSALNLPGLGCDRRFKMILHTFLGIRLFVLTHKALHNQLFFAATFPPTASVPLTTNISCSHCPGISNEPGLYLKLPKTSVTGRNFLQLRMFDLKSGSLCFKCVFSCYTSCNASFAILKSALKCFFVLPSLSLLLVYFPALYLKLVSLPSSCFLSLSLLISLLLLHPAPSSR